MSTRHSTVLVVAELPQSLRGAYLAYLRHLKSERSLSPATVAAYSADVASLLEHLVRMRPAQRTGIHDLDLAVLRSWLARLRSTGAARTSLARRAAAARAFTSWAVRAGLVQEDFGARLISPRATRALPPILG